MKKQNISEYIIQILIVIIGVFLGMLVTEWNAQRTQNSNRDRALLSIKSEIKTNLQSIKDMQNRRQSFNKSLDSLSKVLTPAILNQRFGEETFQTRLPNWNGLGLVQLNSSMFEAAKYSNILANMDFELLEQLSKVYQKQLTRNEIYKVFLNKFVDIKEETPYKEVIRLMWGIRQELWGSEYFLVEDYESTLKLIN